MSHFFISTTCLEDRDDGAVKINNNGKIFFKNFSDVYYFSIATFLTGYVHRSSCKILHAISQLLCRFCGAHTDSNDSTTDVQNNFKTSHMCMNTYETFYEN